MRGKDRDSVQREAAILRHILTLIEWRLTDFKPVEPPLNIKWFIHKADLRQLQGLLVSVLVAIESFHAPNRA